MGTTICGMAAQYLESVIVELENRLVLSGFTLPQRKAARSIVLRDENFSMQILYKKA